MTESATQEPVAWVVTEDGRIMWHTRAHPLGREYAQAEANRLNKSVNRLRYSVTALYSDMAHLQAPLPQEGPTRSFVALAEAWCEKEWSADRDADYPDELRFGRNACRGAIRQFAEALDADVLALFPKVTP